MSDNKQIRKWKTYFEIRVKYFDTEIYKVNFKVNVKFIFF